VIARDEAEGEHAARHVARSAPTALVMDVVGCAEVQAAGAGRRDPSDALPLRKS
jgi:hypothetical protein